MHLPPSPRRRPLFRRRRRARRRLALLALLVGLAGVGALAVVRERPAGPDPSAEARGGSSARPRPAARLAQGRAPHPREARRPPRRPAFRPAPLRFAPTTLRLAGGPRGGLLFDLDTGRVLWSRRANRALTQASLTKVMTALLVVEATRPRETVRVSRAAARVRGSETGLLAGRRVRVEALLHGLLLASGNDAAIALAEHVAGSQPAFVAGMNRRARAWGLTCTRYVSVHGLGRGNRSCPRDLAKLTQRAMRAPRVARIAGRRAARVRLGGERTRTLVTTNPLLRSGYAGTLGLKTGWTPAAGRCLLAVVRRGGRRYGVVALDDRDTARTVRRLLAAAQRR